MISCLSTLRGGFGIGDFLQHDGRTAAHFVRVLSYEDVFAAGRLPLGACVFMGLDELTPTETLLVARARTRLAGEVPPLPLFNDPARWLPRGELLAAAFDAGLNRFRVHRATAIGSDLTFPVFIRSESQHTGALSSLLRDRTAVLWAVARALARGVQLRDLLVVEYCHTADEDGVFRKYSAMILGTTIVPRSLTLGRGWVTKMHGRFTDQRAADEELEYLRGNPHEEWIRRVAALGGVDYGRIDYGLKDGRPQLWEINTNPTIAGNPNRPESGAWPEDDRRRMAPGRELFNTLFLGALSALDAETGRVLAHDTPRRPDIHLPVSSAEHRRLTHEREARARRARGETWLARIARGLSMRR